VVVKRSAIKAADWRFYHAGAPFLSSSVLQDRSTEEYGFLFSGSGKPAPGLDQAVFKRESALNREQRRGTRTHVARSRGGLAAAQRNQSQSGAPTNSSTPAAFSRGRIGGMTRFRFTLRELLLLILVVAALLGWRADHSKRVVETEHVRSELSKLKADMRLQEQRHLFEQMRTNQQNFASPLGVHPEIKKPPDSWGL
jgi:hypothetical protein